MLSCPCEPGYMLEITPAFTDEITVRGACFDGHLWSPHQLKGFSFDTKCFSLPLVDPLISLSFSLEQFI